MVEVNIDTNLLLRKAIHFHDKEARKILLEMIAANEEAEEKIDFSSFKVQENKKITYYDTLGEAIIANEEKLARALMGRNELLTFYFGKFIAQKNWDAVYLFTRIYLEKFPGQNIAVFEALMAKALKEKNPTYAITVFRVIASVDALTAEKLRPMVEEKIALEQSLTLKIALDTSAPVKNQS